MIKDEIIKILSKRKTLNIATTNGTFVDNAIVSYALDDDLNLYFGAYSDTLKCRNINDCPYSAITIGPLQIHAVVKKLEYGSEEYLSGRRIYDARHPQFQKMFEQVNNELYKIKPLVIWLYNPKYGAMHRDVMIIDQNYYNDVKPYTEHKYPSR